MFNTNRKKIIAIVAASLVIMGGAAFAIGPPPEKSATDQAVVEASNAETVEGIDQLHDRPITMSQWSATGDDRSHLVVISHGFGGDRTSHDYLATELANQGYTVIAPTHPDMAGLQSGDPLLDPLVLRPRHLSLAIDTAERTSGTAFDHVSVIGHSFGSYSALRLAGADVSLAGAANHCTNNEDPVLCTPAARDRFLTLTETNPSVSADPRVDELILLAPGYAPLFSAETLAEINVPVMVVQASNDDAVVGDQIDTLLKGLPEQTEARTISAGHFDFVRICTSTEAAVVPDVCASPSKVERGEVHAELLDEIATFLAR